MKYMNILAGAIGLMALAACNAVIEQPKALSTITVAYNRGADTPTVITPNPDESYPYQYATEGIKVSWESGDQIALIKDGTKYIYETEEAGDVATFTLVGGTAPSEEGDYKIVFPADWTGDLSDFAAQDMYKFTPKNYLYATGTATLTDGAFAQTATLTPLFSFIYVQEDTEFQNMYLLGFREDGYVDEDNLLNIAVDLSGTNLFGNIENYEAPSEESVITITNLAINCATDDWWAAASDYMIAIPVLEGKPVTDLRLSFDGSKCWIYKSDGSAPLTIEKGGLIYRLDPEGDSFYFRVQ